MYLHLNGVPPVVDEEDDWVELVSDHGGDVLHMHLKWVDVSHGTERSNWI